MAKKWEASWDAKPYADKEVRSINGKDYEVILRRFDLPEKEFRAIYPELDQRTFTENGVIIQRDVPVKMRDGITIYVDVYRPELYDKLDMKVPAIIGWSACGKRAGENTDAGLVNFTFTMGEIPGRNSKYCRFEGPDPMYWCHQGYAVVSPDPRGIGNSEGDVPNYLSRAEARDAADLINWTGEQTWCNGKVGMSGNSWLATIQWITAAEQPEHLAAIAPWEAGCDLYRDVTMRGGIRETEMYKVTCNDAGFRVMEDTAAMNVKYPLMNDYYEDKFADFSKITVPIYCVGSWTNVFHSRGTMFAWRHAASDKKWLRIHDTMEWPDYRSPENVEDLKRFFDRYLKGVYNGWEMTPKVRVAVCDPGGTDEINRPELDWPLPQTEYKRLHLDANGTALSPDAAEQERSVRYDAEKGSLTFRFKCDRDMELTGYARLRLWVEADGSDDMDLFVRVQKLDEDGKEYDIPQVGYPDKGFRGYLRVSHRALDEKWSTDYNPIQSHRQEELLKPGEIVPVDVEIWPMSNVFHAGQYLSVTISGYFIGKPDCFKHLPFPCGYDTRNKGVHIIHTGGQYDSYLQVPVIPSHPYPQEKVYPRRYMPLIQNSMQFVGGQND